MSSMVATSQSTHSAHLSAEYVQRNITDAASPLNGVVRVLVIVHCPIFGTYERGAWRWPVKYPILVRSLRCTQSAP